MRRAGFISAAFAAAAGLPLAFNTRMEPPIWIGRRKRGNRRNRSRFNYNR